MDKFSFARQPILDNKLQLFAYEFLFRPIDNNELTHTLTAEVLASSIIDVGLLKASNNKPAFINMSYNDIMSDYVEALPAEQIVLELLEDIKPNTALNERVSELVSKGYSFALDDFVYTPEWDSLIDLANFIKFDLTVTTFEENKTLINQLQGKNITFLAEKVETYQQYKDYKRIGCELFQGYFFCMPEKISGKVVDASTLAKTKLIADINQPDISVETLEDTFKQHPTLTFNLLKYLNSAHFSFTSPISTIKQAIVILGMDGVKKWSTILSLRDFSSKPAELRRQTLARAKLAELIATNSNLTNPEGYFLMGLISALDAVLDFSKEEILEAMPLSLNIKSALLQLEGEMGQILKSIYQHEAEPLSSSSSQIPELYIDACQWADDITSNI